MADRVFISTTGSGLSRASGRPPGAFQVEFVLSGVDVCCLAVDPKNQERVYAGTQNNGVFRSDDCGRTWTPAGLAGYCVKAIAVSPTQAGRIYAGTRSARLYLSDDAGASWQELRTFRHIRGRSLWFSPAEPPFTAYVQGIALSPTDSERIVVGIEAGATVMSTDGGMTWSGHLRGALRDCHNLSFHPSDGRWVYEAGGTGGGAAFSRDGGCTWTTARDGLDRHYGWAVAADPADPDIWYVSQSPGPFKAHGEGSAEAYIYRRDGAGWRRLAGGLPQPLTYMPYALAPLPGVAGSLYAGLSNGDVWYTGDYGESWQQLPVSLGVIRRSMIVL